MDYLFLNTIKQIILFLLSCDLFSCTILIFEVILIFNADFVHLAWYVDKNIVYILNTARIFHSRFTCNIYNTQNLDTKQICCLETALLFRPHKINIEILYFIKYYNAFERDNFK